MNVVTLSQAVQVLANVVPLIQAAIADGKTSISAEQWDAAVGTRDGNLAQLDKDVGAASGGSGT